MDAYPLLEFASVLKFQTVREHGNADGDPANSATCSGGPVSSLCSDGSPASKRTKLGVVGIAVLTIYRF